MWEASMRQNLSPFENGELQQLALWAGMVVPVVGVFAGSLPLFLVGLIVPPAVFSSYEINRMLWRICIFALFLLRPT